MTYIVTYFEEFEGIRRTSLDRAFTDETKAVKYMTELNTEIAARVGVDIRDLPDKYITVCVENG